jgi:perosamine synthetase
MMRVRRTLPPVAALLAPVDLLHGVMGTFLGPRYARRLEAELREHFGARYVFLVSSGKAALALVLSALKRLSKRSDVVLPAYTCFSVPAAVERAQLAIRLADVDPETFDFDYRSLASSIGPDTLCVVAPHLFGIPADIERLRALCASSGAFLIEDAAQAMGGLCNGKMAGSLGDVGFFSVGRGKNITAGSGGIILTNSDPIAAALASECESLETPGIRSSLVELARVVLMSIFIRPTLYWLPAGLPFLRLGETFFEPDFPIRRMSGASAGLLRHWRDRLATANGGRAAAAAMLDRRIGREGRPEIPYLRLPVLMETREARDRVWAQAVDRGLGVGRMYPAPVNEIEQIRERFLGQAYPSAKSVSERLLTLPTHHLASEGDRRSVCELLEREPVSGRTAERDSAGAPDGVGSPRWS